MPKIIRDDIDRFFTYGIDVSTKTIHLDPIVDSELSGYVVKGLHVLDRNKPDTPITMIIENYGGEEYSGLAIYGFMAREDRKSEIHAYVYGACMSMAAWILQAADHRSVHKYARFMIHDGYMGLDDNHPEINKRWMKQWEIDKEEMFNPILFDRMLPAYEEDPEGFAAVVNKHLKYQKMTKRTKFTQDILNELLEFDTILSAEDTVKLGLADEVIE